MNELTRPEANNLPATIDLGKIAKTLEENQRKISTDLTPHSFLNRILAGLISKTPFQKTNNPQFMENIRADLRGIAIDLTFALPSLLQSGKPVISQHQEIMDLYEKATGAPDNWELTAQLDKKLQEEALKNASLRLDPETEELVAMMIGSNEPKEKQVEQDRIFAATIRRLDLTEPIVSVTEASIKAVSELRKNVLREYSTVMALSPALDRIHSTSNVLLKGAIKGRESQEAIIRVLAQGIETVSLVSQAEILNKQLYETNDLPRLRDISNAAREILEGAAKNEDSSGN